MIALDIELAQGSFVLTAKIQLEARAAALFGPSGAGKTTILDAIAVAGGTTRLANESSVEVTRDGQKTTIKVNLTKLRKNPNLNKHFTLDPGDSISVPQSRF